MHYDKSTNAEPEKKVKKSKNFLKSFLHNADKKEGKIFWNTSWISKAKREQEKK